MKPSDSNESIDWRARLHSIAGTDGQRSRGWRAFMSLLIAVACFFMVGLTAVPAEALRPRHDSSGKPILRPDGRPALERDYFAELAFQWPCYSFLGLTVFFIVRAGVILIRPQPHDFQ